MFEIILIIFLLVLSTVVVFKLTKKDEISKLISFSIAIMFIIWYLIPVIITLFNWNIFGDDSSNIISYDTYLKYTLIDLFYFLVITFLFLILSEERQVSSFYKNEFQTFDFIFNFFFYFSVLNIILIIFSSSSMDYAELNDLTVSKGLFYNTIAFFLNYSVAFLILILLVYKGKVSNIKYILSHILYFVYSLKMTLMGGRINLLGPILIYLYLYIYEYRNRFKLLIVIPILIFSLLAASLLPILAKVRVQGSTMSYSDFSSDMLENIDFTPILAEFAIKTNSVYYGAYLCEFDGIGAAGINPYINSLYSLLPRFLYPNKPVPTSKDGTEYGTPSRVAANLIIGDSSVFNVGVPSSLVSLWHGGVWAYFFNIIFTVWLLLWLNKLFSSGMFFWQLVTLLFINIPVMNVYITFDQFIRDVPRHFVIYFAFCILYSFYKTLPKNEKITF